VSKTSKKNASERRKTEKAKRKAAEKAKYLSFKEKGLNSKRGLLKKKSQNENKMRAHSHPHGNCGNLGCKLCFPENAVIHSATFQAKFLNYLYPHGNYGSQF